MEKPEALFMVALMLGGAFPILEVSAEPIEIADCRVIDQPGSYVLTKDITSFGGICLDIQTNDVTIDLADFTLMGQFQSEAIQTGGADRQNITVRNGTISNFRDGVLLSGLGHIVERLRVVNNVGNGIITGSGSAAFPAIVRDNFVVNNNGDGITASGILSGNLAEGNLNGIVVRGSSSTVSGNTSSTNQRAGFLIESESTLRGNVAVGNNGHGFEITCPSFVMNNTAQGNFGGNLIEDGGGCVNVDNLAP